MIGIYIRVSSATQVKDGYSLTAQKERLTAFCKAQGWVNFKFYIEEGLSAKNTKRPVYQELMDHVENKKVNTVLVYKLDRIMRSIGELDSMLKTFEKYDCAFKSATEPFDTSNATGKLFIYLVGALAQWEIELSSERIKMVLEEKVANEGVWIGNVPYPFDLDEKTQKLVPNKERSKVMIKIVDMYKKGNSSNTIAEYLNEHNSDKLEWHHNTILRLMRNPALCGDTRWVDKVYEDTHEGILTRNEYEKLQEILSDRTTAQIRNVESTYIFQGKIVCPGCDEIMRINRFFRTRKDGTSYQGAVHRCPECAKSKKFNRSPSESKLLKALYHYMKNDKLDDSERKEVKHKVPDHVKEFEAIENKRARYQRAWANEHMTDDEFQERMEETRTVYDDLKERIKNYKKPMPVDLEQIKNTVLMFNDNFKLLSNEEKREFIAMFIRKIKFKTVEQKPVRPDKSIRGAYKIEITEVVYY